MDQIISDFKYVTSVFFSPGLSESQIRSIVNQAYNEALQKQVANGVHYTTVVNGETITIVLGDGGLKSAWGSYNFWNIFNNGGKK